MKPVKSAVFRRKTPTKKTLFEKVPCPLCQAQSFTIVYPGQFPADLSEEFLKKTYRSSSDQALFEQVVRCRKCQLVYLSPRLKPELIIDSYADGEDQSFIDQDPMRIRTFEKALRRLAKQQGLTLSKKTRVLDIGCAGGAFLRAAKSLGLSTVGIEPNRWLSEYAKTKHKLDVRPGVLSDHHFPDATFDLITLWDVIEHVPEPASELQEIYRILKPGGTLVINYPDYSSLPARLLGRKWPFWLSVHLTYYTPATIKKQLAQSGFTLQTLGPHWQTLELGYVFKRMVSYFSLARLPQLLVRKLGLEHLPITYWVGQTKVVAKK